MSLILEALRKSEAERRRGRPPDLHAELPPAPVRRMRSLPRWIVVLTVFAVIALLAGWLLRDRLAPARTQPAQITTPRLADSDPTAAEPQTQPARVDDASLPARTPAPQPMSTSAPAPQVIKAPVPAAEKAAPAPAPTATDEAIAPTATDNAIIPIAELDPQTRKALPPLKLTMHLWNQDPARRIVILDGQRLGEGDRVGEASVASIEPDGVVLEWQGRRLRVPLR